MLVESERQVCARAYEVVGLSTIVKPLYDALRHYMQRRYPRFSDSSPRMCHINKGGSEEVRLTLEKSHQLGFREMKMRLAMLYSAHTPIYPWHVDKFMQEFLEETPRFGFPVGTLDRAMDDMPLEAKVSDGAPPDI